MSDATDHTPLDVAIARLASPQHGVVSLSQLVALGLSASAVRDRVEAGRLHPLHRGVYAVGHRVLSTKGRWMAAVLACGEGALLSHRSAAELHGLRLGAGRARVDVTSPTRAGRKRSGIDVHSAATLKPADIAEVDRIPCTAVPRTLLDLAEVTTAQALASALERAVTLHTFDLIAIHELLDRCNGRRGAPRLEQAIAAYETAPTRNELERVFLRICRGAGLPKPQVNTRIDAYEVDFAWGDQRLIVETDGHETHSTRAAIERDHKRDRRLRALGWHVERFTWREVTYEPQSVAQALAATISAAASAR